MMNDMEWMNFFLEHDGGTFDVEITVEHGCAVIHFGGSFTLRVNEHNVDKLRAALHGAGREMQVQRAIENACSVA